MASPPRVDAGNEPLAVPVRRWWTRLSSAHILIFSAGALAFVANLAVLRPAELPPAVAIATIDLLPGTVFDPARHVDFVPMASDDVVLAQFVSEDTAGSLMGHVVDQRVSAGTVLPYGFLVESQERDGRRIMSIPIDPERAAGGTLAIGDLVDVIAVERGEARYIVVGLEIVALPESKSGSFTGSAAYHVTVAVDSVAALELSAALESTSIQIVRSTGSPPPSVLEVSVADGS